MTENTLQHRLALLHAETPSHSLAGTSIGQRLACLGTSAGHLRRPAADHEVAARLGGRIAADHVIVIEREIPLASNHGRAPLAGITQLPEVPWLQRHDPRHFVFIDTETTGLAGGTGTMAFLVGAARIDGRHLRVRQYFLTAFAGEPAALDHIERWAGGETHLVSYNGKRFDLPLLAARYRLAGSRDPFAGLPHLDLLHPVRTAFRTRWPDCRLATVEHRLLGFARTNDLPGAAMPGAWLEFLRGGHLGILPAILEHNLHDVVSLAALMPALAAAYSGTGGIAEPDAAAVARAWSRAGMPKRALRRLNEARERLDEAGLLELARLHRRDADWGAAVRIWDDLAHRGSIEAIERLAIYHEHVAKDPSAAAVLAERLGRREPGAAPHLRRIERLDRKLRQARISA
ncbi:MAG: hypothetical protein COW56_08450 [Rhodocyclales bacterium CG17_big_fil_post_rev_8_21_14_2_50_68_7]|nr:MAG: hypothetical protein COW56_08450 [Rhodocyclales bacterium CG17_big_fil_post_rev_8_21_14_2_50_68_7]